MAWAVSQSGWRERVTRNVQDKHKERLKAVAARLYARYVRLVFATSRRDETYHQLKESYEKNAPLIIGGWHGTFMLAPVLLPEPKAFSAVVARHGDAEIIGLALERFGVKLIRGSGAGGRKKDRGGMFALRMSLRELKAGRSIALTADMPPGPARRAGLGIITIAKMSGRPILPVAAVTSRFRVLNTWSRFFINLPFSKLVLLSGDPVLVPKNADRALMEEKRLELETKITALVTRGHEMVGADPARAAAPQPGDQLKIGPALKIYRGAMRAAQPLARPILMRRVRRGKEDLSRLSERFGRADIWRPDGRLIWFHAASVGETNAVLPVIKTLRERFPAITILLTSGTVTSAKIAADRLPEGALHQFIPLDAPRFMQRFLDYWRPDLALLVESEIWPNLVLETAARKIPLVLLNGIISGKTYRSWRKRPGLARPIFGRFHLVLVQNQPMQKNFLRLGTPDVRVVGNLKFDAPPPPVDDKKKAQIRQMIGERPHFLAASTHKGEEEQIIAAHKALQVGHENFLTLIVPRHPERGNEIAALVKAAGLTCAQRSKGEQAGAETQIYIADTLGEIGNFFALAQIVFLGGSLVESGGHNPVEVVQLDGVVITGPHWHNQADSFSALLKFEGACEVRSSAELARCVDELMHDEVRRQKIARNAERIIAEMTGALERSIEAIMPLMPLAEKNGATALASADESGFSRDGQS